MLGNLTGFHLIIILAIILLLFGAPKLPGLAKSIAQSMRIFKNEIGDDKKTADDDVRRSTVDDAPRSTSSTTTRPVHGDDLPPKL
ncbi:sec-independent protein translocase protein TatA [Frigoribacterium sp. PvP120]|uniref:twin-arginine translocase TatA/TatE family subunit n=1 Tax=unclassified Frigoribacterium TaxID=2627005 RepID=UPI001AE3660B|nr:twin-arginine translocase TatA/TatE family subunit [Frigoribacterium sp. PvP121]MBP1241962.1 sec-independent protein translocase protein TatA [Frigoribacterium sp. PvP121]